MTTILTVVGARPQFIKAAAVSRAIRARDSMSEIMVHTGQHFDANMSDVFFDELEIAPPAHHLGIGGGGHGRMTGRMLEGIEEILEAGRPDWVLIYGDTNSTIAGALAAALGAARLLLLTDVSGVLDKQGKLLTDLTPADIAKLREDGTISGGMIPKLETCVNAVEAGCEAAVVLDGRVPHAMLLEFFTQRGAGTLISAA